MTRDLERLAQHMEHDANRALCGFLAGFEQEETCIENAPFIRFTHPVWRGRFRPVMMEQMLSAVVEDRAGGGPARSDRTGSRREFYLPVRHTPVGDPPFPCPADLREFYQYFDGLREEPPPMSGHFVPMAETPLLGDLCPPELAPDLADLASSPVVFHAPNGDYVFMTEREGLFWYQLETGIPVPAADSFSSLLQAWMKHHAVGDGEPFDSFGRA